MFDGASSPAGSATIFPLTFGQRENDKHRDDSRSGVFSFGVFLAGYFLSIVASEHLYGALEVPSPFWLPDAVLLCALLFSRPGSWWLIILAIWPIRFVAGAPSGTPAWFLIFTIVIDSLKALVAASVLKKVLDREVRLNTFSEFMIFLGLAAAAVPLVSASAAAPARHMLGDSLWAAGYRWFMGDALAQVVVTPALVYWCAGAYRRVDARLAEFALMSAGLIAVSYYAFVAGHHSDTVYFYAPAPFLIWAALRLHPFGVANAIGLLSLVAVLGAVKGSGAFSGGSPGDVVLSIQLFVLWLAIPSLSLAILIDERESRTRELEELVRDRSLAKERLQELSGGLIDAQEQERARIARELHDDFCQRLAMIPVSLHVFQSRRGELSTTERHRLSTIADDINRMSSELRQLSHRLHPSTLDILGLVDTLNGLCQEFRSQHRMDIRFVHRDVPERLPTEVSACAFRVVQEALRNVEMHSGVRTAAVELSGRDDALELRVSDAGAGFDPHLVRRRGIGLISMRERLRLVGGRLEIESAPSHGTTLRVSLPATRGSTALASVDALSS